MINETKTFEMFGYTSDSLSKGSSKKVVRVCDGCGEEKIIRMSSFRNLCRSCGNGKRLILNDKLIYQEYSNGMNTVELSKKYNCDRYTITKRLKKQQKLIKPKFIFESERFINTGIDRILTIEKYGYDPIDLSKGSERKVIVICQNCNKKYEIAFYRYKKLCGKCSHLNINNRIKHSCSVQGIPIEDFGGFLTNQKYCVKFNESLKTKIRDQYNNCDYISGIHKSICSPNRNLDVHHVNYDKQQGCNGKEWKLIPLSRSNHMRTNGDRQFWNRLFIYSLEIDKEYYGDE